MAQALDHDHFTAPLQAWYDGNRRDLPWRRTKDPYAIWVSEAMLQQTQVSTVIPYYERFMAQFPTVASLAEAREDDVLHLWEGLGYYSRARNLQCGARMVMERFGGRVPDCVDDIRSLTGVGSYMAGAISSIAHEQAAAAVDGNVLRVMSRLLGDVADVTKTATRQRYEEMVIGLMPGAGRRGDFTQALMELGALVCTPKNPACGQCPVRGLCRGKETPERYPVKPSRQKPPTEHKIALVARSGERMYLRRRPDTGLLAKMWEFPIVPAEEVQTGRGIHELAVRLGLRPTIHDPIHVGRVSHAFSHRVWQVDVYAIGSEETKVNDGGVWVAAEGVAKYTLPAVQHKILRLLKQGYGSQESTPSEND